MHLSNVLLYFNCSWHRIQVIRRQVSLNFALKEEVHLFTSVPKNTFDKTAILLHKVTDVSLTTEATMTQP